MEWPPDLQEWVGPALPVQSVTSRVALASLGLGLLAIFPLAGIAAILLGHLALLQISRSEGLLRGRDVAKLGLICGYVGVLVFCCLIFGTAWYSKVPLRSVFVSPLSAASAPGSADVELTSAVANEHEVHAIQTLVQLHMAEQSYSRRHPLSSYTCEVSELRTMGFPTQALVSLSEQGYVITIQQCREKEPGRINSYTALAISRVGIEGRNFCTDQTGVVRVPVADADLLSCAHTGTPLR